MTAVGALVRKRVGCIAPQRLIDDGLVVAMHALLPPEVERNDSNLMSKFVAAAE